MAKITLDDHLDSLLDDLMSEKTKPEELQELLKKSKAVVDIAKAKTDIIKTQNEREKTQLDQLKFMEEHGFLDKSSVTNILNNQLKLEK